MKNLKLSLIASQKKKKFAATQDKKGNHGSIIAVMADHKIKSKSYHKKRAVLALFYTIISSSVFSVSVSSDR